MKTEAGLFTPSSSKRKKRAKIGNKNVLPYRICDIIIFWYFNFLPSQDIFQYCQEFLIVEGIRMVKVKLPPLSPEPLGGCEGAVEGVLADADHSTLRLLFVLLTQLFHYPLAYC